MGLLMVVWRIWGVIVLMSWKRPRRREREVRSRPLGGLPDRFVEAGEPFVIVGQHRSEHLTRLVQIERLRNDHLLDIRPVLGPAEHRLEDGELDGAKYRDRD